MILLTTIAVGLLSLSAVSLRTRSGEEANARAFANARLAVMMAIGELQKELGDDRRISADASIQSDAAQGHLVGAWNSWSPNLAANPLGTAPDYNGAKTTNFRTWLASSPTPAALKSPAWAATPAAAEWPVLYTLAHDGFALKAPSVVVASRGALSWAATQENTKAKVNVAGPEEDTRVNVALQAQRRPSLALASGFKQPDDGWNLRAGRVLSLGQIGLDTSLTDDASALTNIGASFTVHSKGLLTDAVKGGLKTDLSLGFELSDSEFASDSWDGVANPFRETGNTAGFTSPGSYKGQRALFQPLVENPIVSKTTNYSPATVAHRFYAAGVPTFDHLRSFCRIPHHLYGGAAPVAAMRGPDHVAVDIPAASGGAFFGPSDPPQGVKSTLAIRPVLNRLVYLLSATLGSDNRAHIVITPIISLWNPHNTALEIDGAVAYPWMDIPFRQHVHDDGQAVRGPGARTLHQSILPLRTHRQRRWKHQGPDSFRTRRSPPFHPRLTDTHPVCPHRQQRPAHREDARGGGHQPDEHPRRPAGAHEGWRENRRGSPRHHLCRQNHRPDQPRAQAHHSGRISLLRDP